MTTELYNPNDGLHGRDGGPYLDQVQREQAEVVIARREGREPDFENLPLTPGTPLVTADYLLDISNSVRIAGDRDKSRAITVDPVAVVETPVEEEDEPVGTGEDSAQDELDLDSSLLN